MMKEELEIRYQPVNQIEVTFWIFRGVKHWN